MGSYIPPAERARKLLNDLDITQPPVQVEEICDRLNIEYMYGADIDSEALIIKGGKRRTPLIAVKSNKRYEARVRFSVAHEVGHFCIPSHLNETYSCTFEDLNSYQENKSAEKEANEFAAERLMPSSWIQQKIKPHDVTLELIKHIASECGASLTATALQVTKHCKDHIAVVYSINGYVAWFAKAQYFNSYLETGKLSKFSVASRLFQPSTMASELKDNAPPDAWTYDDCSYGHLIEESLFMPYLNSALTILTIPYDEYIEEDEGFLDLT